MSLAYTPPPDAPPKHSKPLWQRLLIQGLLWLAEYLTWNYKRLERCKVRNLKRRTMVTETLSDLTHYEDKP